MQEYRGFIVRKSGKITEYKEGRKFQLRRTNIIAVARPGEGIFGIISSRYPFSNILIPESQAKSWNYSVFTPAQMEAIVELHNRFKNQSADDG